MKELNTRTLLPGGPYKHKGKHYRRSRVYVSKYYRKNEHTVYLEGTRVESCMKNDKNMNFILSFFEVKGGISFSFSESTDIMLMFVVSSMKLEYTI